MHVDLLATADLPRILPAVAYLNPGVPEALLAERLETMTGQGYRCAAALEGDEIVGVCGIWVTTRLYCGLQIEADNVVVLPEARSRGVGRALMAWVYRYARSIGCETVELNAYLANLRAHEFYRADGFDVLGYHFPKKLADG